MAARPHPPSLLEQFQIPGHLLLSIVFTFTFEFLVKCTISTFQAAISCLCYSQDFGKTSQITTPEEQMLLK